MIREIIEHGGPISWFIMFLAVVAISVFVERLFSLMKEKKSLIDLRNELEDDLNRKDFKGALEAADSSNSIAGRLFFEIINKKTHKKIVLKNKLEETSSIEVPHYWKNLNILSVIVTIAPLLGLLGTVFGMLTSFGEIEAFAEAGKGVYGPSVIAGGIKKALITTVLGLSVAIPVYMGYSYLTSYVERLTLLLEKISYEMIDLILENRDSDS
ncbi:MAG: hypothetical protein COA79_06650 [Planctomycetota bacterium]|nr:MAG: hypothetical protein COA79_06650 [Planctomycetota bacterium]